MLPRRRRVLAAKVEATPGTAESLTTTEACFNVYDLMIQPNISVDPREGQGGFSPLFGVPGARMGTCTFSTDVTAENTIPKWASVLLPACGFVASSNIFSPVSQPPGSGGVKTLTLGGYIHGVKKALRGCMGNAVFRFTAGGRIVVNFTFTGIWIDPADVAMLANTRPTLQPMRFASAGLSIGGYSPKIRELTLDFGNQVIMREDANDPSGCAHAVITGRNLHGHIDPELVTVATKDYHNEWLTMVEQALAISLTAGTQLFEVDAPKMQFLNVQEENRNDLTTEGIDYQLNRDTDAGDDEVALTIDTAA